MDNCALYIWMKWDVFISLRSVDTGGARVTEYKCRKAAYGGSTAQRIFRLGAAATSAVVRPTGGRQGTGSNWAAAAARVERCGESKAGDGARTTTDGVGRTGERTSTSADTAAEWQHCCTAASGLLLSSTDFIYAAPQSGGFTQWFCSSTL